MINKCHLKEIKYKYICGKVHFKLFSLKKSNSKGKKEKNCYDITPILNLKNDNKTPSEKEPDLWTSEDLIKNFEKMCPIKFNKKHILKSDQNLTSFIQYDQILNKLKAVAISKNFLEKFINFLNSENENEIENLFLFCEQNLINRINVDLEQIKNFKRDKTSHIKYYFKFKSDDNLQISKYIKSSHLNTSLKKVQFDINLYNIKNYIFLGIDPSRKIAKNIKLLSYLKDTFMSNPIFSGNQNNLSNIKYSPSIDNSSVRTDIISTKENIIIRHDLDKMPLCLISQFEFSLIPVKNLKINLEVEDTLNEKKISHDFEINSLDFVVESEILRITIDEMRFLEKEFRDKYKQQETICSEDSTNEQFMNFLSSTQIYNKFKYDLKIIDIENYLNGNELI